MPEEHSLAPILKDMAVTHDHALVQGANHLEATKNLEAPLEGILMKTSEIAQNTKPKDVQRVSIEGAEVITIKGEKGDKPSDEKTSAPSIETRCTSLGLVFWAISEVFIKMPSRGASRFFVASR